MLFFYHWLIANSVVSLTVSIFLASVGLILTTISVSLSRRAAFLWILPIAGAPFGFWLYEVRSGQDQGIHASSV